MSKVTLKAGLLGALCAAGLAVSGPVRADQADPAIDSMLGAAAIDTQDLASTSGREGFSLNNADLSGVSAFNQANGANTGRATIAEGALSNFAGTAAVVVNSGNNAVIQVSNQVIFNLY